MKDNLFLLFIIAQMFLRFGSVHSNLYLKIFGKYLIGMKKVMEKMTELLNIKNCVCQFHEIYDIFLSSGYAPQGTEDWHFSNWQKIPQTSFRFIHLRPFTTYKFVVNLKTPEGVVYNGTGVAQTTTSPAIPSAPQITNINQTNAGLVLYWTTPGSTNGALKNYIIEMTVNNQIETWETIGPVQKYILDTQQFNPGQK